MAIGKRLRFEIFKRDGFRCVYCGATPTGSALQVDHVLATANGGTDDEANLVTSCQPCNGGKSAVPLEERRERVGLDPAIATEHAEQIRAYLAAQRELAACKAAVIGELEDAWRDIVGEEPRREFAGILLSAIKDFPIDELLEVFAIVANRRIFGVGNIRYFCGILRNRRNLRAQG
jgi:hypothetical protein